MAARSANPGAWGHSEVRNGWTDLGDGVLKDARTGLEWTRAENGRDIDWDGANAYCSAKKDGWRVPDRQEISAIDAEDGNVKAKVLTSGAQGRRVLCVRGPQ
jgi:hypothetical protein